MPGANEVYHAFKATNDITGRYNLSPKEIRPCIAKIMTTQFKAVDCPSRSLACNIICSEMLRIEKINPEIELILSEWNSHNDPPLRKSHLDSTLRTAERKLYNYSCNNQYLQIYCVDGFCPFKKDLGDFKYANNRNFYAFGWSKLLSSAGVSVYHSLIEYERRKGVGAGGLLILTYRNIANISISLRHVGKVLKELENCGLIKFKIGTSRKWQKRASEISRIIPIPKPNGKQLIEIENKREAIYGKINNGLWQ